MTTRVSRSSDKAMFGIVMPVDVLTALDSHVARIGGIRSRVITVAVQQYLDQERKACNRTQDPRAAYRVDPESGKVGPSSTPEGEKSDA